MPEVASQTLDFVGRELNLTLAEARTALENYVEQPDNVSLLERCTQELHQVQGVLRVLEIYGAALLAEEMEQVASYLLATATERKSQAESLDALMRAMVQLPSYLERVLAGGRDLALVLLPLLNDLRAVRGSALLSEGTLLLLNLKSDKQAQPIAAAPGEPPLTVEQWARRLRARFQVGLIGWIRGERTEQNLDILAAVAQKLEQIATRQPVFQLWWVIGAIIEALQENGIEGGVSVKRLLGLGRSRDPPALRAGRGALLAAARRRAAQQPVVLRRPRRVLGTACDGRARLLPPRPSCCRSMRASSRSARTSPLRASSSCRRSPRPSARTCRRSRTFWTSSSAAAPASRKSSLRRSSCCARSATRSACWVWASCAARCRRETERLREDRHRRAQRADEATLVEIAATLIGVEDRLDDEPRRHDPAEDRRAVRARRGRRVPTGAGGGAARVHSQPRAHQGSHHSERRRHAGCGGPR